MKLVNFNLLVSGMDEDLRRIGEMAENFERNYEFILSWLNRGIIPPIDFVNEFISSLRVILSDMISIAKECLKESSPESYDANKIDSVFRNSMKYVESAEDEITKAISDGNAKAMMSGVSKLYRIFYQFVYGSLSATKYYIERLSRYRLAEEVFRRLGMTPQEEAMKKTLPSFRGGE